MSIDKIDLTDEEETLLDILNIHTLSPQNPDWSEEKGEAAHLLTTLLLDREGIPDCRKAYFGSSDYNTGRTQGSRYDDFIKNCGDDDRMMRHPNFLKFVRYFIFGARLPLNMKQAFAQDVANCGMFTSGDHETLLASARRLFRQSKMDKSEFREEIYKLALDCDLSEDTARHFRKYL